MNNPHKTQPDSPDKNQQLDSKTVAYEVQMLCGTTRLLNEIDKTVDQILYNAVPESFAIHCHQTRKTGS